MTTSRRIIEGTWTCSSCETQKILGRHKTCPSCGSPRESEEMDFDFGSRAEDGSVNAASVQDKEVAASAVQGADWFCAACGSGNNGAEAQCIKCGSDKEEASAAAPTPAAQTPPKTAMAIAPIALALVGLAIFGLCCSGLFLVAYLERPLEVDAEVTERNWVRQTQTKRLEMTRAEAWRDALPKPAGVPGEVSRKKLAPGLGKTLGCETLKCWPRPPQGQTLARITGRKWSRTIRTRVMKESSKTGWKSSVPSKKGAMPLAGKGGKEGRQGSASCTSKVRVAKKCRDRSKKVQCGTVRKCKVIDKGNGFAEEVCKTKPKYCTEKERVCDPEVRDKWCTWTMLQWRQGRTAREAGETDKPEWPKLTPRPRERLDKSESYTVEVETLAGPAISSFSPAKAKALMSYELGQQVFVESTSKASALPPGLILDGEGKDCGDGIPRGELTTRDSCRYERWAWKKEGPQNVSCKKTRDCKGDTKPQWPETQLGDDRKIWRQQWLELRLSWARSEEETGEADFLIDDAEASSWPMGRKTTVKVDGDAKLIEFVGEGPRARVEPPPKWE